MLLFFQGRSRECPIWQALYNQVSFCKGFWSKKITYKLEEKHVTQQHSKQHPGSKSGNIWQFVHGEKPVIFNSYKESDWGLSPALEFCFTKHESVLSEHFTAKAFLCRLAGHWSCLAGHVLGIWVQTLSSLIWVPQNNIGCLLITKFCFGAVIWEILLIFFSLQARKCIRQQVKTEFTT